MQLSTFIPPVTIICWWISQCSKVTNLWIFCYQGYIERTPVPWHFGDLARGFHWEPSFNFITVEVIVRTTIIVLQSERLWMVEVSIFFVCVPFSSAACTDCGYCLGAIVLVVYFGTGISWLISLRPGNLLLINFWNNFGIRNYFGCSVNCSIKCWW